MSNQELRFLIKNELQISKQKHPKKHITFIFKKFSKVINEYTNFLSSTAIVSEKLYCYINNITEKQICSNCKNTVEFISFKRGYRKFCSSSCSRNFNKKNYDNTRINNLYFSGNAKKDIDYYLNKNIKIPYKYIYINYSNIIDLKIKHTSVPQEKIYCYLNKIYAIPKCKQCGNDVSFFGFKYGYGDFCSNSCMGKNDKIKTKKLSTATLNLNIKYTGNFKKDIDSILKHKHRGFAFKLLYNYYKKDVDAKIEHLCLTKINEKLYCYYHNITSIPKCDHCKTNNVLFGNFNIGYGKCCSYTCSALSEDYKTQCKNTSLKNYGVEYPSQSKEIKEKKKQTSLKNYGVEYPSQSPIVQDKKSKNKFKFKEYEFPSGKIVKIQGYENYALDILLETYDEDQILTDASDMPKIWYYTEDNKKHRYYCDIFIPHENKLIEVKSEYTYDGRNNWKKINLLKQETAYKLGFDHKIWIMDNKGNVQEII